MSLEHSPARQNALGGSVVDDPSLTISGFCAAENISRSALYQMWEQGTGPDFYFHGVHRRISNRAEWRRQRVIASKLAEQGAAADVIAAEAGISLERAQAYVDLVKKRRETAKRRRARATGETEATTG
jgi:hypothetical protein